MGSMDQAMHEEFAARTYGQTFHLGAGYFSGLRKMLGQTPATNARPAVGEDVVADPEQDGPCRIIERFALRLPEVRRLPGGLAWFESGPAVVNRFARIEVRSPFGALVRDQWSYV